MVSSSIMYIGSIFLDNPVVARRTLSSAREQKRLLRTTPQGESEITARLLILSYLQGIFSQPRDRFRFRRCLFLAVKSSGIQDEGHSGAHFALRALRVLEKVAYEISLISVSSAVDDKLD